MWQTWLVSGCRCSIAMLCARSRLRPGKEGDGLAGACMHWRRVSVQHDSCPLRSGILSATLRMTFCCIAIQHLASAQDQVVSVASKCFCCGAVGQFAFLLSAGRETLPTEKRPRCFPYLMLLLAPFCCWQLAAHFITCCFCCSQPGHCIFLLPC